MATLATEKTMKKPSTKFRNLVLAAALFMGSMSACTVRDDDHAGGGAECDAPTIVVDGAQPDASNNPDARVDAPIDAGVDAPTDAPTLAQCYISIERVGGDGEISEQNQSLETLRVCRRMGPNATDPVCTGNALEATLAFSGTATRSSDYTVTIIDFSSASQGTIEIESGVGCAMFVVAAQQDTATESMEDIDICVVDTSSYQLGSPGCQEITIRDDDTMTNQAPVAGDDTVSTLQNQAVVTPVATLLANDTDPNGNMLTITSVSGASNGTVSLSGNNVTFTPATGFVGTAGYNYTVSDGSLSDTAHVTVMVNQVNHTPVANPDTATTLEDTMVVVNVMDNDSGLNDLPLTLTATDPPHGSTVVAGNAVQYTPDPDFCGTDTFSYTVRDADNQMATAQVTVTVTCVVDPIDNMPNANPDTATTVMNTLVNINVLANDTGLGDGGLTVTVTDAPHGTVTVNPDRTVRYTPDTSFTGTDTFSYTVRDVDGDQDSATVTVTVGQMPGCTTDVDCNHPAHNFIVGVCVGPTAAIPVNHCEWHTEDCGQLEVDTWPTARYITPWGTHGSAPDVEFTTVIATPGTWQLLQDTPGALDGACSARAYDVNWNPVPIRSRRMWNRSTMSPLMPFWTRQQADAGWYAKVTFDGFNLEQWPGALP